MKPRTKLQFRVVGLSSQLPDIKSMMTEWANNDCLNHIGYATKSRVVCMECGERFSTELVNRKRAVCPHCGASLKIEWSRKRTNQQFIRIGKADICEEFQVIRCFELYAYYREGREPHYFIREVLQHWIKDDGKREVMALARNTGCSGWCGNLEIRNKTVGSYYSIGDNDVYCDKYHPDSVFKPQYTRMGIDYRLHGLSFLDAINAIPVNPKLETLLKAKRYDLLSHWYSLRYKVSSYWPSIKSVFGTSIR